MSRDGTSDEENWRSFRRAVFFDGLLWLALIGLTASSLLVATHSGRPYGFIVALCVAALQAALLGLFFMQLRRARPLILLTAASSSVFILSMFALTFNDLFTRP